MYSDFYQDEDLEASLSSFESALKKKQTKYFEVHELEFIVDYYFSINNLAKAETALDTAFQIHPANYELKKRKAQLYNLKGQFSLAYQEIESLVQSFGTSDDIDYYMILGESLVGSHNLEDAKKIFSKALSLADEDYLEVSSSIATVYQQNYNYNEAIKYLEIAVQGDSMLYFDLAISYQSIKKYNKAIWCSEKFLKQEPYSFDAWFLLYHLYVEKGLIDKAEDALLNTIAIVPDLLMYKHELASFYSENERYIEALEVFQEILEQNKEVDIDVLLSVADICLFMDLPEKALKNFQNVLSLSPNNPRALYGIAKVRIEQEDFFAATDFVNQALKEEPSNPEYLLCLADILSLTNKMEDADFAYKNILEKYSNFEEGWDRYFDFLYFNKDYKKAIALADEAIYKGLERETLEYKIVAAYCQTGQYSNAVALLSAILNNNEKILKDFKTYYPNWGNVSAISELIKSTKFE